MPLIKCTSTRITSYIPSCHWITVYCRALRVYNLQDWRLRRSPSSHHLWSLPPNSSSSSAHSLTHSINSLELFYSAPFGILFFFFCQFTLYSSRIQLQLLLASVFFCSYVIDKTIKDREANEMQPNSVWAMVYVIFILILYYIIIFTKAMTPPIPKI